MGEFYWKLAKSFKTLAILSLAGGITYGLVEMLLSFSSGISAFGGFITFILCIIVSIIGSAPLYVLGEVVDRIDDIEGFVRRAKNNRNISQIMGKTSPNQTGYSNDELRKMGLTSLKSLYEDGEISQSTYERIISEKMSNQ